MNRFIDYVKTIYKVGLFNVLLVIIHRLKLKLGLLRGQKALSLRPNSLFSLSDNYDNSPLPKDDASNQSWIARANELLYGRFLLFFHQPYQTSSPPSWFYHSEYSKQQHWSKISLNSIAGHDIKLTWELSRFQWLPIFALAYKSTADQAYFQAMNLWCIDWINSNPVNNSANWTCGQECSIRLIHTLQVTHILHEQLIPNDSLKYFVIAHLQRIEPTINYSIAQDNNHGTSEAAGLYIGAAWLELQPGFCANDIKWARRLKRKGQRILQQRINKLVGNDGGFSMSSTNYHRVVLNTVSVVDFWRKKLNAPRFSAKYQRTCRALCYWLYKLTDINTGGAPNLGANDGSNPFLVQTILDYQDFRPAIQFAAYHLFNGLAYNSSAAVDEPLNALGLTTQALDRHPFKKESELLINSGVVVFHPVAALGTSHAFLKFPVDRFRPFQADMMHFDLWVKGRNILSDAGSYSYCAEEKYLQDYFASIKAHNTVQIDDSEPMRKLSPFLFGQWPKMASLAPIRELGNETVWQGKYNWPNGASHQREVHYRSTGWLIIDRVRGAKKNATLRWRLTGADWLLDNEQASNGELVIIIRELKGYKLTTSLECSFISSYYNAVEKSTELVACAEHNSIDFITEIFI